MLRKFLARTSVVDRGKMLDYTATVLTMDKTIRRVLEAETFDSDQAYYDRYVELHRAKHSETFEPVYRDE